MLKSPPPKSLKHFLACSMSPTRVNIPILMAKSRTLLPPCSAADNFPHQDPRNIALGTDHFSELVKVLRRPHVTETTGLLRCPHLPRALPPRRRDWSVAQDPNQPCYFPTRIISRVALMTSPHRYLQGLAAQAPRNGWKALQVQEEEEVRDGPPAGKHQAGRQARPPRALPRRQHEVPRAQARHRQLQLGHRG